MPCVPVIFNYFGCFKLSPTDTPAVGQQNILSLDHDDCAVYISKSERASQKQRAYKEIPALTPTN